MENFKNQNTKNLAHMGPIIYRLSDPTETNSLFDGITHLLSTTVSAKVGSLKMRQFPDGESYLRILDDVKDKEIIIIESLDKPNEKYLPLLFLAKTLKEYGAKRIGLVCPYLSYMRQDIRFQEGEALTSEIFAKLLSNTVDWMVTVDPHLHRHHHMSEIYSIPSTVLHAEDAIVNWIKSNVVKPVLIGPDEESEQWVKAVALKANAPFLVLKKTRYSDTHVEVSIPDCEKYTDHTPVLIDDIISTAQTLIKTLEHIQNQDLMPAICIGVHGLFALNAFDNLKRTHVKTILTCNTVPHSTNQIDLSAIISREVTQILNEEPL